MAREDRPHHAAHRVHARAGGAIRTGEETGIGRLPSREFKINQAWLTAAMTAQTLLAWLRLLALDSDLAGANPGRCAIAPCTPPPRARRVPQTLEIRRELALGRGEHPGLAAYLGPPGTPPDQHQPTPATTEKSPGPVEPPGTRPASGPPSHPGLKTKIHYAARRPPKVSNGPRESSGLAGRGSGAYGGSDAVRVNRLAHRGGA